MQSRDAATCSLQKGKRRERASFRKTHSPVPSPSQCTCAILQQPTRERDREEYEVIPYCVFALQRRSYREGEQSFGFFFCSSRPDRSLRKGGERGGGQTLEDSGGRRQRQIRLLPPIAPSPASPVKKGSLPFFAKRGEGESSSSPKAERDGCQKKFNPSSSSSFQHYAARRRCYTRAPLPLLILTTTTSKFKRSNIIILSSLSPATYPNFSSPARGREEDAFSAPR